MNLFDRRVAITVGSLRFRNKASADELPDFFEGNVAGNFTIRFKVDRDIQSSSNAAQAQILNLNDDTRGRIVTRRPSFAIEAGFRGAIGGLFLGTAVSTYSRREETEMITEVVAQDGLLQGRRRVRISLRGEQELSGVVESIADQMGLNLSDAVRSVLTTGSFDDVAKKYFNGVAISGDGKTELDKVFQTLGVDWSIQNGELVAFRRDKADSTIIELSPDTGLVGGVERVYDETRRNAVVVRGRSLLQSGIQPYHRIAIDAREWSGVLKVERVTHTGDTSAPIWFSDFEGVELR